MLCRQYMIQSSNLNCSSKWRTLIQTCIIKIIEAKIASGSTVLAQLLDASSILNRLQEAVMKSKSVKIPVPMAFPLTLPPNLWEKKKKGERISIDSYMILSQDEPTSLLCYQHLSESHLSPLIMGLCADFASLASAAPSNCC